MPRAGGADDFTRAPARMSPRLPARAPDAGSPAHRTQANEFTFVADAVGRHARTPQEEEKMEAMVYKEEAPRRHAPAVLSPQPAPPLSHHKGHSRPARASARHTEEKSYSRHAAFKALCSTV